MNKRTFFFQSAFFQSAFFTSAFFTSAFFKWIFFQRVYFKNVRPRWRIAVVLSAVWALGACAGVTPWVKPYERQNLATPAMAWSRDGLSDGYMHHVYQARESARGSEGGSGGGCGCN